MTHTINHVIENMFVHSALILIWRNRNRRSSSNRIGSWNSVSDNRRTSKRLAARIAQWALTFKPAAKSATTTIPFFCTIVLIQQRYF